MPEKQISPTRSFPGEGREYNEGRKEKSAGNTGKFVDTDFLREYDKNTGGFRKKDLEDGVWR